MEIQQEELGGKLLKVTLNGAFDIAGAADVDMPFSIIAGNREKVLVDFTNVDFLASIGIRILVRTAQAMGRRGGKLVVFNPNEAARKVMVATGIDAVVPIAENEADAIKELL